MKKSVLPFQLVYWSSGIVCSDFWIAGMPDIDIGVNDLRRQGKEIVGRHDIIPVVTEEWIRLENVEFHSCVQQDVYEDTKTIK